MRITFVPHGDEWRDAVEAFNARMRAGGSRYGFYVSPVPRWGRKRHEGQSVWRDFILAVEDGEVVRAAYVLKPQEWWIRGATRWVADWQGPYSEGAFSPRYGTLGVRILRDMQRRQPLLYSWGHGGQGTAIFRFVTSTGWLLHPTPFLLRVVRPFAFARRNAYLRRSRAGRLALDALAYGGVATVGGGAMSAALRLASLQRFTSRAEVVPVFAAWADAIWERARQDYAAMAVRSAGAMNALIPPGERHHEWSEPIRLRVRARDGATLGWAVVFLRVMHGDDRFGTLTVGSIADALAPARHAGEIVHAALRWLMEAGSHVVIANQSDPRWIRAFVANAFVCAEDRRHFCASPALTAALAPFEETRERLFLTNMDGHGPMGL